MFCKYSLSQVSFRKQGNLSFFHVNGKRPFFHFTSETIGKTQKKGKKRKERPEKNPVFLVSRTFDSCTLWTVIKTDWVEEKISLAKRVFVTQEGKDSWEVNAAMPWNEKLLKYAKYAKQTSFSREECLNQRFEKLCFVLVFAYFRVSLHVLGSAYRLVSTKSLHSLAGQSCNREIDEFSYSVFIHRPRLQSHLTG